jgi:hypothetical protein
VIVFAAACLFLIYSAIEYRPVHGLALLVMLLLGCIVYAFQGPPRRSRMVGGISEEGGPEHSHNDRFSESRAAGGQAATEPWTNSGGDQHE